MFPSTQTGHAGAMDQNTVHTDPLALESQISFALSVACYGCKPRWGVMGPRRRGELRLI